MLLYFALAPRLSHATLLDRNLELVLTYQAIKKQQRVEFRSEWFDPDSSAVPDPDMIARPARG